MELEFRPTRGSSEVKVVVRSEGLRPLTRRLDLSDEKVRAEAIEAILQRYPGADRERIEEEFDKAAARPEPTSKPLAERLIELLARGECVESFHSPDGTPYATVAVGTAEGSAVPRRETLPIGGSAFREWLTREAYVALGKVPSAEAITTVTAHLASQAKYEGAERRVDVRTGEEAGAVWLDLANNDRELVRIDKDGWSIVPAASSPVRLVRRKGMLELPRPERGGSIEELRPFLNLDADGWVLVRGFVLMLFSPSGPFPILILNGEQGSAKSTASKVIRRLMDPNQADARRPPKEPRDLAVAAANSRLVLFDNLSGIPAWLGDDLCALTSGNGFSTRALYTDGEEAIFQGARPVILNGIDDLATRGDIADRSIVLHLKRIEDGARREERGFWARFDAARPRILGAFLDALAISIARRDAVTLTRNVRLADFGRLVEAGAPALGLRDGEFLSALFENRDRGCADVLEGSPFALAVRDWTNARGEWTGTADDLRKALPKPDSEHDPSWPRTGRKASDLLRRYAPALRSQGIEVHFGERSPDSARRRLVRLVKVGEEPSGSSGPSGDAGSSPSVDSPPDDLDGPDDPRATFDYLHADAERDAIQDECIGGPADDPG